MSPGCVHKGVRKDALMIHMKKTHGQQFNYAELQSLFREQLEVREARSKLNRNIINSLNGYQKRTTDAYINTQWKKHVASTCRNKCWPNLPPVERRGKGKQRDAIMPSSEEMEKHRLWFVQRTKSEALRREREAKQLYQIGGDYQPSEGRHSCRSSDPASCGESEQESSDERSLPSEHESESEENSLDVEDASTPRGETSGVPVERTGDSGSASGPLVIREEGPVDLGETSVAREKCEEKLVDLSDASAACVDREEEFVELEDTSVQGAEDCVNREECPGETDDAKGASLDTSVCRGDPSEVSEQVRVASADGSQVPPDSPVAPDSSRAGELEEPVVAEKMSDPEGVEDGIEAGTSALVEALPDVGEKDSVRVEETLTNAALETRSVERVSPAPSNSDPSDSELSELGDTQMGGTHLDVAPAAEVSVSMAPPPPEPRMTRSRARQVAEVEGLGRGRGVGTGRGNRGSRNLCGLPA
ncbi:hypothetical protein K3495_g8734 [Podosphaera aphanis]|nr:hypothetical protein K3495_g8734 [Podosphaera aphanis]